MDGRTLLSIAAVVVALAIVLVVLQALIGIALFLLKAIGLLVGIVLVLYGAYWAYSYLR